MRTKCIDILYNQCIYLISKLDLSCREHIDFKRLYTENNKSKSYDYLPFAFLKRHKFYKRNSKYKYVKYFRKKIFKAKYIAKMHDFCDIMLEDNDKNLSTRYRDRVRKLSEI